MSDIGIAFAGIINDFQTIITAEGKIWQRKVDGGEIGEWKLMNKPKEN